MKSPGRQRGGGSNVGVGGGGVILSDAIVMNDHVVPPSEVTRTNDVDGVALNNWHCILFVVPVTDTANVTGDVIGTTLKTLLPFVQFSPDNTDAECAYRPSSIGALINKAAASSQSNIFMKKVLYAELMYSYVQDDDVQRVIHLDRLIQVSDRHRLSA